MRRVLGLGPAGGPAPVAVDDEPEDVAAEPPPEEAPPEPEPPAPIACPSCAQLVDPPPARNRRCPHCRQMIVVRHMDGRPAYLTVSAVAVFEAERQRELDEHNWDTARARWLELAASVKAPQARAERIAATPISAAVVEAARTLYTTSADHAATEARREKRWADLGRLREVEVLALYADAGSPLPPPDELLVMYREGKTAVLRALAQMAPDAELVGALCCKACRADDGKAFTIAKELREPRLPHEGCPKGLCACDWWLAIIDHKVERKRRPRAPRAAKPAPEPGSVAVAERDAAADAETAGVVDPEPASAVETEPAADPS